MQCLACSCSYFPPFPFDLKQHRFIEFLCLPNPHVCEGVRVWLWGKEVDWLRGYSFLWCVGWLVIGQKKKKKLLAVSILTQVDEGDCFSMRNGPADHVDWLVIISTSFSYLVKANGDFFFHCDMWNIDEIVINIFKFFLDQQLQLRNNRQDVNLFISKNLVLNFNDFIKEKM